MSQIAECKKGGQEGILTTVVEQVVLAAACRRLTDRAVPIDAYIPLPGMAVNDQIGKIAKHNDSKECSIMNVEYWENDKGSHGWCCTTCGKVHQWG